MVSSCFVSLSNIKFLAILTWRSLDMCTERYTATKNYIEDHFILSMYNTYDIAIHYHGHIIHREHKMIPGKCNSYRKHKERSLTAGAASVTTSRRHRPANTFIRVLIMLRPG